MFEKLPTHARRLAEKAYRVFVENPEAPGLCRHPLHDTKSGRHRYGSVAVSITKRYRAIYVPDEEGGEGHEAANVWHWIGTHEDYNNFVGGQG